MKKIILIAYNLNPKRGSECGIANLWVKILSKYYYIEAIVNKIHKKDILTENYQNISFHFIEENRSLRKFLDKIGAYPISYNIFITKVKSLIKNKLEVNNFYLIHCITPEGIHSYNNLYKFGIPVVIGPLGGGLLTPKGFSKVFKKQFVKNTIRDLFYRYCRKNKRWQEYFINAKKIIVGSELIKEILPEQVKNKSVVIFDTLVDTSYFVPNFNKVEHPIKKILFAGMLESKKGVILLIEAVKLCIVERAVKNFVVEIAGAGPLEKEIKILIKKYKLEKYIKLIGKLSKFELLQKYQNSDIFCLPTLREPGGTAILEAMACGLPVITSDYGGPKYSVTENCGIKIKVNNYNQYVKDLADAIIRLLLDDNLRKQMGRKARERAEREFSIQALEKKLLSVYEEISE